MSQEQPIAYVESYSRRRKVAEHMSSKDIPGINWSADRLVPAFQTPKQLTIYDLRGTSMELLLSAATMAGLINRPQPQVYLKFTDDDETWLKELHAIPQATAHTTGNDVLKRMLTAFPNYAKGMVIYDPSFKDSINIATTIAGQNDCIIVSPTQAQDLAGAHNLSVHTDLRSQHWDNRSQAYDWARQNLLNGASFHAVAGLDPTSTDGRMAGLRSFLVANRIFVYWLDSNSSEQSLMEQIYKALPPLAVHLGWFIDESSGVKLTSKASMPVLATDFFSNLEVWTSVPATTSMVQPKRDVPAVTTDSSRVYLSFTISDGDNLQYIQHRMLGRWQESGHDGSFPLGWTISPVLSQAASVMAAYYARTAKPTDELIAGPSGAGYMFPSEWSQQQLPAFLQLTGQLMKIMNLTTLEVLDMSDEKIGGQPISEILSQAALTLVNLVSTTSLFEAVKQAILITVSNLQGRRGSQLFTNPDLQPRFTQALSSIGLHGILSGAGFQLPGLTISPDGLPVYYNLGLADTIQSTIALVKNATMIMKQRPLFLNVYILTWSMGPSDIKQAIQRLGNEYEVVTPGTLLKMIAQVHSQKHS